MAAVREGGILPHGPEMEYLVRICLYTYEEDPTELSGLMDGKRLLCKTNLTPFSSLPNSRVGSRVNSRAGSPTSSLLEQRYHQYGSTIQEDAEIDV